MQMVDLIRSSGATLERLLTDILDSAKIEAGQVTLEPTVFDLKHTVNDIALLWRAKAEDKGVALVFDLDPTAPKWVEGDAVRLRQILTNLVSNALKFTDRGTVTLSVSAAEGDRIAFAVRDTGIGFDADQKARIFQRFPAGGRLDHPPVRRHGPGPGHFHRPGRSDGRRAGLRQHAGPGLDLHLHIDLPASAPPVAATVALTEATDIAALPLRILLADDHPANRKVIEIMLAATAMELIAVEDGRQALDAFMAEEFDLVLMDMQMPVMDGSRLRQQRQKGAVRSGRRLIRHLRGDLAHRLTPVRRPDGRLRGAPIFICIHL